MTKAKTKLSKSAKDSIEIYGDGLRELLSGTGMNPEDWDSVWELDDDGIEDDPEIQWIIGWFVGAAEALGVRPSDLITLDPTKAKKKPKTKKKTVKGPRGTKVFVKPAKKKSKAKKAS